MNGFEEHYYRHYHPRSSSLNKKSHGGGQHQQQLPPPPPPPPPNRQKLQQKQQQLQQQLQKLQQQHEEEELSHNDILLDLEQQHDDHDRRSMTATTTNVNPAETLDELLLNALLSDPCGASSSFRAVFQDNRAMMEDAAGNVVPVMPCGQGQGQTGNHAGNRPSDASSSNGQGGGLDYYYYDNPCALGSGMAAAVATTASCNSSFSNPRGQCGGGWTPLPPRHRHHFSPDDEFLYYNNNHHHYQHPQQYPPYYGGHYHHPPPHGWNGPGTSVQREPTLAGNTTIATNDSEYDNSNHQAFRFGGRTVSLRQFGSYDSNPPPNVIYVEEDDVVWQDESLADDQTVVLRINPERLKANHHDDATNSNAPRYRTVGRQDDGEDEPETYPNHNNPTTDIVVPRSCVGTLVALMRANKKKTHVAQQATTIAAEEKTAEHGDHGGVTSPPEIRRNNTNNNKIAKGKRLCLFHPVLCL